MLTLGRATNTSGADKPVPVISTTRSPSAQPGLAYVNIVIRTEFFGFAVDSHLISASVSAVALISLLSSHIGETPTSLISIVIVKT